MDKLIQAIRSRDNSSVASKPPKQLNAAVPAFVPAAELQFGTKSLQPTAQPVPTWLDPSSKHENATGQHSRFDVHNVGAGVRDIRLGTQKAGPRRPSAPAPPLPFTGIPNWLEPRASSTAHKSAPWEGKKTAGRTPVDPSGYFFRNNFDDILCDFFPNIRRLRDLGFYELRKGQDDSVASTSKSVALEPSQQTLLRREASTKPMDRFATQHNTT